jgi:hypothetical protein
MGRTPPTKKLHDDVDRPDRDPIDAVGGPTAPLHATRIVRNFDTVLYGWTAIKLYHPPISSFSAVQITCDRGPRKTGVSLLANLLGKPIYVSLDFPFQHGQEPGFI